MAGLSRLITTMAREDDERGGKDADAKIFEQLQVG